MADKVSTNTLMRRLVKADSLDAFLQKNEDQLKPVDFCDMLQDLCRERALVPERVILKAQIDRTYGHQLFNGTRRPSRAKVLQLAFGMELGIEETQCLLRAADRSPLYPRLKRDAVVLFCLSNHYSMEDTQEQLASHGLTQLGGIPKDGE